MIKFRLSEDVKTILNRKRTLPAINREQQGYYNSPEFYAKHPDLMPRNVYLALGRVISREQINKNFNKLFPLSFKDKCLMVFNRIKKVITGKK